MRLCDGHMDNCLLINPLKFSVLTGAVLTGTCYVILRCRAIVDDVGDHLMPEQSVLGSPDDLCRAHFVPPTCIQAV